MNKNEYRAWDKNRKSMLYSGNQCGDVSIDAHELTVINYFLRGEKDEFYGYLNKDLVYLQFIGLLDVSNTKIYEGDIIELNGVQGIVEFAPEKVGFLIRQSDGNLHYIEADKAPKTEYKVVGNIYEKLNGNA